MHSFRQDLTCVTYPLFSETMHLLQAQLGRGGRREALKIIYSAFQVFHAMLYITYFRQNLPRMA